MLRSQRVTRITIKIREGTKYVFWLMYVSEWVCGVQSTLAVRHLQVIIDVQLFRNLTCCKYLIASHYCTYFPCLVAITMSTSSLLGEHPAVVPHSRGAPSTESARKPEPFDKGCPLGFPKFGRSCVCFHDIPVDTPQAQPLRR